MPNILLELLCEEIPACMQIAAMEHLKKAITNGLVDAGLTYENPAQAFVTPRRLVLHVVNVPIATKPQTIERKGPRVGAPDGAIQGFLKAAGLAKIDQAELQDDGKGGQFYIAKQYKEGRPTAEVVQELVRKTVLEFPWPKSMRWGSGTLNWVRPLHNICCTLSSDTDVEVIDCSIENVTGKAETRGHTFLAPAPFAVKRFEDYIEGLEKNYVVLDRERRKQIILADARTIAFAQGLELVEDQGLLEEIAGLVEWPVVLMGSFDEAFLNIPERVIQTTIRVNQKCFVLKDATTQKLANKFILVSNLAATDGGEAIIAGNERVIRARLSDAKFFWENDQSKNLIDRVEGLKNVVFHERLGTQWERVGRIEEIAAQIMRQMMTPKLEHYTRLAARLAKADLLTEMVGEFPELQGYMGRRYAEKEGLPESVCIAIEDHYKPRGPNEMSPSDKIAKAVSLADKLDMLVSFWSIGEKPTGSKDPYALRRAALGVIRILMEGNIDWSILNLLSLVEQPDNFDDDKKADLVKFFAERLKVQLVEKGFAHDIINAVLNEDEVDFAAAFMRVDILSHSLSHDHGKSFLQGFRRANNILVAEYKKTPDLDLSILPYRELLAEQEQKLFDQIQNVESSIPDKLRSQKHLFTPMLSNLANLSTAIHTYIENTMINDPDPNIRLNRLRLLAYYRRLTRAVADFEKIEG